MGLKARELKERESYCSFRKYRIDERYSLKVCSVGLCCMVPFEVKELYGLYGNKDKSTKIHQTSSVFDIQATIFRSYYTDILYLVLKSLTIR